VRLQCLPTWVRAGVQMTAMTLAVGDPAPDFELPIRGKETLHLSEALQKGPVVLLTYIFDFSPG